MGLAQTTLRLQWFLKQVEADVNRWADMLEPERTFGGVAAMLDAIARRANHARIYLDAEPPTEVGPPNLG
jgi:hypothetical protein